MTARIAKSGWLARVNVGNVLKPERIHSAAPGYCDVCHSDPSVRWARTWRGGGAKSIRRVGSILESIRPPRASELVDLREDLSCCSAVHRGSPAASSVAAAGCRSRQRTYHRADFAFHPDAALLVWTQRRCDTSVPPASSNFNVRFNPTRDPRGTVRPSRLSYARSSIHGSAAKARDPLPFATRLRYADAA